MLIPYAIAFGRSPPSFGKNHNRGICDPMGITFAVYDTEISWERLRRRKGALPFIIPRANYESADLRLDNTFEVLNIIFYAVNHAVKICSVGLRLLNIV